MNRRLDDHDLDWAIGEALREESQNIERAPHPSLRSTSRYRRRRIPSPRSSSLLAVALFFGLSLVLWFSMRGNDRGDRVNAALDQLRIDPIEFEADENPESDLIDPVVQEEPEPIESWKRQLDLLLMSYDRATINGQPNDKARQKITDSTSLLWSHLNKQPEHWKDVRKAVEARAFAAWKPDVRKRIAFIMIRDASMAGRQLAARLLTADPEAFGTNEIILLMQSGLKAAARIAHDRLKAAPLDRDLIWLAVRAALLGDPVGEKLLDREFREGTLSAEDADRRFGAALALRAIKDAKPFFVLYQESRGLADEAILHGDLDRARWLYLRLRYFSEAASGGKVDLAHMPVDIKRFDKTLPDLPDAASISAALAELGQTKR